MSLTEEELREQRMEAERTQAFKLVKEQIEAAPSRREQEESATAAAAPKRDQKLPTNEEVLQQQQDREADRLRHLHEFDARAQEFKRKAEMDAEDAKRKKEDIEKEPARRQNEGDIASASARYNIALGEQYDVRDPYGSLARAAMSEYAAFHRNQEKLRAPAKIAGISRCARTSRRMRKTPTGGVNRSNRSV